MAEAALHPYVELDLIQKRLPEIFPEGTVRRGYLTREISAKTLFVMFYVGAVQGTDRWIRPNQVTRMTDRQAASRSDQARVQWAEKSLHSSRERIRGRWYADNTREPIRDETLRFGLIEVGAVVEREGLPTTSSRPRYALAEDFAGLFFCKPKQFKRDLVRWQKSHLSSAALTKLRLVRQGVGRGRSTREVEVVFPNGNRRRMSPGPSSEISKAVIQDFASKFLEDPGVIFLSESKNKVVLSDQSLAESIGLNLDAAKLLPDIILVDLGPDSPHLVFVEVVASDGPVSDKRKRDLLLVANDAGFEDSCVSFLTAFLDRSQSVFRRFSSQISWGSYVWFVSEPDKLISYLDKPLGHGYLHQFSRGGLE